MKSLTLITLASAAGLAIAEPIPQFGRKGATVTVLVQAPPTAAPFPSFPQPFSAPVAKAPFEPKLPSLPKFKLPRPRLLAGIPDLFQSRKEPKTVVVNAQGQVQQPAKGFGPLKLPSLPKPEFPSLPKPAFPSLPKGPFAKKQKEPKVVVKHKRPSLFKGNKQQTITVYDKVAQATPAPVV